MILGFLLDLLLGDPNSMWHPVCLIGRLTAWCEKFLRPRFPATKRGERIAGALLVMIVLTISTTIPTFILWICCRFSPILALGLDSLLCWMLLAIRTMGKESMSVYDALRRGDLAESRNCVARIVGRDTASLEASGVASATVETVAESTVDGILSPLFYLALGFAPLGYLYKATNTMDSMIGYKNEKYQFFGTAAAKLDDVLNFLPARLGGTLMCAAAWLCHEDAKNAWRIFRRDRLAHKSPNSAHTEAAMAGALGLCLGGDASYFGELVHKPTQGDGCLPQAEDIPRANRLMRVTAWLGLGVGILLRLLVLWMGGIL